MLNILCLCWVNVKGNSMIKYLVVLANAFVFSFLGLFFDDSVTVTVNTVESVSAGSDFTVELVIDKSDITSFAKIQTELPEGLSAEGIDLNGGTFSFKNNTVKVIWWNLPPEKSVTVRYKVSVSPSYTDDIVLGGKFSYIINNERKVVELEEKNISISNDATIADNTTSQDQAIDNQESIKTPNTGEEQNVSPSVEVTRSISKNTIDAGESIKVTLSFNTKYLSGYAKVQETIPSEFTVKEGNSNGASFSNTGNIIKFLWMNYPAQDQITIDYTLISNESASGDYKLSNAVFSYVDPNKSSPEKFIIPTNSFSVNNSVMAQSTPEATPESEPIKNTVTPVKQTPKKQTKEYSSSSVKGLNYRVQICATHTDVSTDYFVKNNNVNEEIFMEMHEGWTKFTVGNFGIYKDARDYREDVRRNYNIVGPFVTAYNDGTRITVQEALMMSNQRWYP